VIIPCTNPANNKTFDHRQIALLNISSDAISAQLPPEIPPARQQGMDGWKEPGPLGSRNGASAFVRAALRLLTHADWAVLAAAACRQMHESPAAFDLLSGVLWPLRDRQVSGLPSRNVAWVMLKLMATVPSRARVLGGSAPYCPLSGLAKRQIDELRGDRPARSAYPVSFPRGQRLEAALRSALDRQLRQRRQVSIDWVGLCAQLNRLLT